MQLLIMCCQAHGECIYSAAASQAGYVKEL